MIQVTPPVIVEAYSDFTNAQLYPRRPALALRTRLSGRSQAAITSAVIGPYVFSRMTIHAGKLPRGLRARVTFGRAQFEVTLR